MLFMYLCDGTIQYEAVGQLRPRAVEAGVDRFADGTLVLPATSSLVPRGSPCSRGILAGPSRALGAEEQGAVQAFATQYSRN